MITGSYDKSIKIWDLSTRACIRTLSGHTHPVYEVAQSSDGRWLVSGSSDQKVKIWNMQTNQCVSTLEGHTQAVFTVAISPDNRWIVSTSSDHTLRVWELATGSCAHVLEGHTSFVYGVTITPDNKWIVSGSADNTIRLWDLHSGAHQRTIPGHTGTIWGMVISPDGRALITASWDKTVRIWNNWRPDPIPSVPPVSSRMEASFSRSSSSPSPTNQIVLLKKILQVYTKIKKGKLREILGLEATQFEIQLLDWAIEYNFKIEDEMIMFDQLKVGDFLAHLESEYQSRP